MKVEVKKVGGTKRELKFQVPKDRISSKMEEVYTELSQVVRVKGFRPGKVPRHIIETQHGKLAQEEVIKKVIPEVYHEAIANEKLSPIDLPEILDVNFKDGQLTFTAVLDIRPEIKVKDYKGIKVTRKSSAVTEEEINKTFDMIKQGQGKDKEVAIDDAFAHGLGYPGLADFKSALTRQMEADKDRQNRMDVENQIIDALLADTKFDIPETFVNRQLERRIEDLHHRLRHQGIPEKEIKDKDATWRTELKPQVEKDIKAYLIFDKIAELENIKIEQEGQLPTKIMEFLLKEAKWEGAK